MDVAGAIVDAGFPQQTGEYPQKRVGSGPLALNAAEDSLEKTKEAERTTSAAQVHPAADHKKKQLDPQLQALTRARSVLVDAGSPGVISHVDKVPPHQLTVDGITYEWLGGAYYKHV